MARIKYIDVWRGQCSIHGKQYPFGVYSNHPNSVAIPLEGCPDCYIDWQREAFAEFCKAKGRTWTSPKDLNKL